MSELPRCGHCGANFSLDDLRGTHCPYCQTALPHHARAAEHAVLVNKVLEQQMGKYGYGMPPGGITPQVYGQPPNQPYNPYANLHHDVQRTVRASLVLWFVISVGAAILVVGMAVMIFLLAL